MNAHAPPGKKKTGVLLQTPIAKLGLRTTYRFSLFQQVFSRRRAATRRCVSCDSPITNRSLGGYDGRSALSGPVWCLQYSDFPSQRVLRFGGPR